VGRQLVLDSRDTEGKAQWLKGGYGTEALSRCVCVTDGPAVEEDGLCLAMLPPGACGNKVAISVIQVLL
jgi:hypothetical protein